MPVAVFQYIAQLEHAGGEQAEQDHHRQANIETPEAAADPFWSRAQRAS
jgi:hypothetical protein